MTDIKTSSNFRHAVQACCGIDITAEDISQSLHDALGVMPHIVERHLWAMRQGRYSAVPHGIDPETPVNEPVYRCLIALTLGDATHAAEVLESHTWHGGYNSGGYAVETREYREYTRPASARERVAS
jgi:hypothetical protein